MKRIALAVALFVSLAAPAWAGFEEGLAAYYRGDYATAYRVWLPLAQRGNTEAQYYLGLFYGLLWKRSDQTEIHVAHEQPGAEAAR